MSNIVEKGNIYLVWEIFRKEVKFVHRYQKIPIFAADWLFYLPHKEYKPLT